ncbi:MAG: 2-succinyl-5-enolpyruvyl-6-hydroxy-3-cyclohexene-1-carboxylic-acid synthase [Actinobacteria bacterium]|nr:2-succinyl-5-enolpyruvyl-6-hydroxy-3-cyclohexene-1-carboxylic-acid synthase [Actinomycetota bacterium]
MNPSTALAVTLTDELIRCGLTDAVLAPGSRSAPLAMEWHRRASAGGLRLHVRIDERAAAYLALGLAKASGRPAAVLCTSGTAAASFHPAVIEASEAGVPLLVLTADRPPELRGTGANQAIDQLKLYGDAVRWFSEVGVPEDRGTGSGRAAQAGYWRSLTSRAWGAASAAAGGPAGPVHLNLAFRDPLVPDSGGPDGDLAELDGRPGGAPWVRFAAPDTTSTAGRLELPWTERGLVVCGDGAAQTGQADSLLALAAATGWPVLAEPSSGARRGPDALAAYQYLLAAPGFLAAHRPDVIVTAGRPGLSRAQTALLRGASGPAGGPARHVVIASQPGRWDDPARTATDVAAAVTLAAGTAPAQPATTWRQAWRAADAAARRAVGEVLAEPAGHEPALSEPRLARDLAAALPDGALLWVASSMPIRDLDQQMAPRAGVRVLASRGASGIDGTTSAAIGAALAHQAAGGGPAVALIGDLALLHDSAGLFIGPGEPRPDLCLVVVNNDGGGIFSTLEQASFPDSFERVFGTPHGADVAALAAAAGWPYQSLVDLADLDQALTGSGLRMVQVRTSRDAGTALRTRLQQAATAALVVSRRATGASAGT